jgi:hypothetical protein
MTIEIPVRIEWEPGQTSGRLRIKIADMTVSVSDDDEKLGEIAATVGGGIQVIIGKYTYFLGPRELWAAVSEAHEARLKAKAST